MTSFSTYSTGTVSIGAGATSIVGTGSNWSGPNAKPGDDIVVAGHTVIVRDVVNATTLTIDPWPYSAVTAGTTYVLYWRSPFRYAGGQAMSDVSTLIAALNTDALEWILPAIAIDPTGYVADDGQYIRQPATGRLWIMQSGAWVYLGVFTGLQAKGAWNSATAYVEGNIVSLNGNSYICALANTNQTPPNATYWTLSASKGDQGIQGASYGGTSTTSLAIGTGSKAFTTQAGLAYTNGARVRASSNANAANWMEGTVTYSGTALTMASDKTGGSGTLADWNFNVVGQPGVGDLSSVSNLSDLPNKATSRLNLGSDPVFVFDGDSLSDVTSGTAFWPSQIRSNFAFFNRGIMLDYAHSGDKASDVVARYASETGTLTLQTGQEAYYFIWAGTNDIVTGDTAANVYNNLKSLWASARADGFKVIAFTIMRRSDASSGQNDVRVATNALIRSDRTLYDYLVEIDTVFVNPLDTVNFISSGSAAGVHLTVAGNLIVAQKVAARILGTAPLCAAPLDALAFNGLQINGACEIDERNNGGAVTTTGYVIDGWKIDKTGSMAFSAQRVADAPPGLKYSLNVSVTTAESSLGSGDFLIVKMPIEGHRVLKLAWGTLNAQPLSIGFWTKHHRTGAYGGVIHNATWDRSFPFTYTQNVADTWEFKTVMVPGELSGTWGTSNGLGMELVLTVAGGSTFLGTPNAWSSGTLVSATGVVNGVAATSDVFRVSGAMLLPGIYLPSAQKAALIMRSRELELPLCQRQFYRWSSTSFVRLGFCYNDTTTTAQLVVPLPISEMRTNTPAVAATNMTVAGVAITATALTWMSKNLAHVSLTSSGLTVGFSQVYVASGQTGVLSLDAGF